MEFDAFKARVAGTIEGTLEPERVWDVLHYKQKLEAIRTHKQLNPVAEQWVQCALLQCDRLLEAVANPDPKQRDRTVEHLEGCIKAILEALNGTKMI